MSKPVVIRTSRETLGLLVAAAVMTFAMSYAIRAKNQRVAAAASPPPPVERVAQAPQQDWAGGLAALAPEPTTPAERLTSAALVVPKAALALPLPPAKPKSVRQCGDAACLAKAQAAPPKRQQVAAAEARGEVERAEPPKKSLLHQLNPLNHLPDMSLVGRPFTYAGGTVAGWFKRL